MICQSSSATCSPTFTNSSTSPRVVSYQSRSHHHTCCISCPSACDCNFLSLLSSANLVPSTLAHRSTLDHSNLPPQKKSNLNLHLFFSLSSMLTYSLPSFFSLVAFSFTSHASRYSSPSMFCGTHQSSGDGT